MSAAQITKTLKISLKQNKEYLKTMPSEKEQTFCDKKPTPLLKDHAAKKLCVCIPNSAMEKALVNDTRSVMPPPAILNVSLSYGLRNVKIDLPKVNIPNEVILKHEVDRYRKLFQCKQQTARKSLSQEKVNGSHCSESYNFQSKAEVQFEEEGLKTTAKILNFTCTKCRDKIRYSPNDLQKHFQLLHCGELPSYPCEMCNFSANDFQLFKQHRRIHRSTLVKCEICNDEHMYTLLDLTKHFTSKHCINGHFQCEKCGFSTRDVGTFVQHIHRHNETQYKCGKCHYVSFTKGEFQKHLLVHTGSFPFSCQYCNYSAPRKDYLLKHVIALHRDHLYAKEKDKCEKRIVKTPAGLKLILRRYKTGASRKALWRRKKINNGNDRIEEQNAQVLRNLNKIQPKSEEQNQPVKELHVNEEKDQIVHNEKHNLQGGTLSPAAMQYNKTEDGSSFGLGLFKNAVHGPTVLMVKNNKISVPANYSAKFMGFKMVDGKQHIVIKLLPTNKQNLYLSGQKSDGTKDASTDSLLQTADIFGLSSSATSHVTNQQTLKNNSLHVLTSTSFSAPSGKGKAEKQNNALSHGRNISQTVESPTVIVGKNAAHLPMKPGSSAAPCDLVTKVGTSSNVLSWESCIVHNRPQVLSPTVTDTLHYDPMKMPFPTEFKIQNGGVSNNSGPNHLYYPSVDSSNQGLPPFHNYSKIDTSDNPRSIWIPTDDKPKDFMSNKMFPLQNNLRSDSASSFSQSVRGLNPEKCVSSQLNNTVYGHLNTKNNSLSSRNQSKCVIDRQCFMEKGHGGGKQYLDTNVNQMFENVAEKSKANNVSDCVNSSLMPKITSVFSLHSKQASNYLSPEVNQLLQDVLKVKSSAQQESHNKLNKCTKLHCDQSFSYHQADNKSFTRLKDSTECSLSSSANVGVCMSKREFNMKCSTASEDSCFGKERHAPVTSLDVEEMDKLSRTVGVGTLLKTHTDAIITQQLVKDRMRSTTHNPSSFTPVLPEQKKTLLVQSPPPGFLVPLHRANQPSIQVVSGKSLPSTNSSDVHLTKSIPTSFVLNKGPGMILTLSSGTLGTVANVTGDNSQILGRVASKEYGKITVPTSKTELKNDSFRNLSCSSGVSTASDGAVSDSSNSMPSKAPLTIRNSADSSMKGISSEKMLPERPGTVFGSLESVKQQEVPQKQPVYALLPDGRQAVFLKCMTPNKPVVQKHNVFQDNAYYQPKKTGAMQQTLLLKIKTSTSDATTDLNQSVNSVPPLQLNKMQSFKSPALEQKQTIFTSSDALFLPGRLMPANASLASSNSAHCVLPVEPIHSTKPIGAWSQRCSINSTQAVIANRGNSYNSQKSTWSSRNKISKVKPRLKQTGPKSSEAVVSQRNKNSKRKAKADFQDPPRKKIMLHRKCKEKNQTEVVSKSGGPYRPRASKETVRILKLLPFNSKQLVKCPRRNQPVVVLNHPDADVPEVVNVMKTIAKFKGHVLKVSLSKRTIDALLEPAYCSTLDVATEDLSRRRHRMIKPISPVKERFVLKLTLKKTSKNNYQIVKTTSDDTLKANFSCWFCGRIFDNQDNWVGHGQRHLMEATRDWNSLV